MNLVDEAKRVVARKRAEGTGKGAAGAAPVPVLPVADGDVVADLREAEVRLTQAVTQANLTNDRLRIPLAAIAMGFGAIGRAVGALQAAVREAPAAIKAAADEARKPLDPKTEEEMVERVTAAAEAGFMRRAGNLAKSLNHRTAAWVAIALFTTSVGSFAAGHWSGRSAERAEVVQTETGLLAAFRDGPDAAQAWLDLMRGNDILAAINACQSQSNMSWLEPGGTRACYLAMRLDPPRFTVPTR